MNNIVKISSCVTDIRIISFPYVLVHLLLFLISLNDKVLRLIFLLNVYLNSKFLWQYS